MVTDWLIGLLADLVHSVMGDLPTFAVPEWLVTGSGAVGTVFSYAGSMGAWFPSQLAVTVALAILAAYGVGFAVKLIRIVASFVTLGGGSAA
jgi:hypothetical protein